jgi:hypothetical protein
LKKTIFNLPSAFLCRVSKKVLGKEPLADKIFAKKSDLGDHREAGTPGEQRHGGTERAVGDEVVDKDVALLGERQEGAVGCRYLGFGERVGMRAASDA